MYQRLTANGATILAVLWPPLPSAQRPLVQSRARAIENQAYVIAPANGENTEMSAMMLPWTLTDCGSMGTITRRGDSRDIVLPHDLERFHQNYGQQIPMVPIEGF